MLLYRTIPIRQKEGWSDIALAAEFKRASPSKGDIATELNLRGEWGLKAMIRISVG
jgi:indole-3-glycerol phosphate synthase